MGGCLAGEPSFSDAFGVLCLQAAGEGREADEGLSMGFELDCGAEDLHAAALHFQPRARRDLVRPFCEAAELVAQLRWWGAADERANLVADMAFTRGVPMVRPDGTLGAYGCSLVPGWLKARRRAGELQPAKMYLKASAGPVREGLS